KNVSTGAFAIVATNQNSSSVSQSFTFNGTVASSVTPWITSASLNIAQQTVVTVTSGSFTYTLPADSVTTFIGGTVSLSPTSLAFGSVPQGTTSSGRSTTLTNSSVSTITLTGASISGPNASDFSETTTCGSTLETSNLCTFTVTFSPTATLGTNETATVNIPYTGASGSPQQVSLSGTSGCSTGICLVQNTGYDSGNTNETSATLAFSSNNAAGNWIGVCIRAGTVNETFTVTDSNRNTYHRAIQFNETGDGNAFAIYYAENIAGGTNTIQVSDPALATLRFAILEYSGVVTSGSLDVAAAAQGNSAFPNSGSATTTANRDLLLGAIMTSDAGTFTAGSGYRIEGSVPAEPNTKLIAEDQKQATAGASSASASLGGADFWAAGLAAFKAAGSGVGTSPSITSVSPSSGPVGSTVTITGTNFGATQGPSTVTFNGTAGTPTSWNAASVVVPVPSGATTGNVVVTVGGVASNGMSFTVTSSAPSITSVSPSSGPVGSTVTITGTNFGATQGPSTVTFNGTAGTVTSWSAASIVVPVPSGATTGNVVATVGGV